MKTSFRERNPVPLGLAVLAAIVAVLLVVSNLNTLLGMFGRQYSAELADTGGLQVGDPVVVSGTEVGRVGGIELEGNAVIVEFSVTESNVELGDQTSAEVSVSTLLGDKALKVTSSGDEELEPGATIPRTRTEVPYDVSEALSDLTDETQRIDEDGVSDAMTVLSDTLDDARPEVRNALKGMSRFSRTIASRDQLLNQLLSRANGFSQVLSGRSNDLTAIVSDGNLIFKEIVRRRDDLARLIRGVEHVSTEISGAVKENEKALEPGLKDLNKVITVLRKNKSNLERILQGLPKYATSLGEVVSGGPFFSAGIQNLVPGNLVPPVLGDGASTPKGSQ